MPSEVITRMRRSTEHVFDILDEYQKPGDFKITDGLRAIIAEADNPVLELADLATAAISILQDLITETAKTPAATARRTTEMRYRWIAKIGHFFAHEEQK